MDADGRKRVGLALGGGVGRGLAHIGVLNVLERAGISIDCVSGTSAGSIMGAVYCAGLGLERIRQEAQRLRWHHIASPAWPSRGLVSFHKLERWLVGKLGDLTFADLKIPFAAVATDLQTFEPVVLCKGRLAPAVRASCSFPGFVTPTEIDGRLLGDGFVTDSVPVSAVRALGAEYVIGVDILAPAIRKCWGALGYLVGGVEIMAQKAGQGVLQADCTISPDLAGVNYLSLDYHKLVALGERAAEAKLPIIQAALSLVSTTDR
jgi:NTE family protein